MDWKEVITTIAGSSLLTTSLKGFLDSRKAKHKTELFFIERLRSTLETCSMLSLDTWGTEPDARNNAQRSAVLIDLRTVELLQQLSSLYSYHPKFESSCKQAASELFTSLGNFNVDAPLDEVRHRRVIVACSQINALLDNLNRKHS